MDNPVPATYYLSIMASGRFQRRIDRLMDDIGGAADRWDGATGSQLDQDDLVLDLFDSGATKFIGAAEPLLGGSAP